MTRARLEDQVRSALGACSRRRGPPAFSVLVHLRRLARHLLLLATVILFVLVILFFPTRGLLLVLFLLVLALFGLVC